MKQLHYVDHCLPGKTATTTRHNRTLHCEMTCKFYKANNISSFRDSRCLEFACCWSCEWSSASRSHAIWGVYASVNSTCAQLSPGLLLGICPACQSRVWGICKFCTAHGPGICQPQGHSRAFDTHAVSYQNITTQKVLLEKKQIGSSVKDRNKW